MAIRVTKFPVGKGFSLDNLNRTLLDLGLRASNVLNASAVQLGTDQVDLVLTYDDTTAPFVVATIPSDGEQIAPGGEVIVIFSEPIQAVTVSDIEIFNITDSVTISTSLYAIDNSQAGDRKGVIRIQDTGGFLVDQKAYRYSLLTTIKDTSGNTMLEPYDLLITVSRSGAVLSFDGGRVSSFTNPNLNRWEAQITPTRITLSELTNVQLTPNTSPDGDADGFNVHYERLISPSGALRIVVEHGNRLILPEPTGILPSGYAVDYLMVNGLM
jgi:hypothetical protein